MMTSWNGNISRVTGPLCGKIPLTKSSDAELWYFLWSAPEQTVGQTIVTLVIWDAMRFPGNRFIKDSRAPDSKYKCQLKSTILSVQETRCGEKTVVRSSYFHNAMAFLYRIRSRASRFEIPCTVPDYSYLINPITTIFCACKRTSVAAHISYSCKYFIFLQS